MCVLVLIDGLHEHLDQRQACKVDDHLRLKLAAVGYGLCPSPTR